MTGALRLPISRGAEGVLRSKTSIPTPATGATPSDPETASSSPSKGGIAPPIATGFLGFDTLTVEMPNSVDAT